jgi:hypothetical protein
MALGTGGDQSGPKEVGEEVTATDGSAKRAAGIFSPPKLCAACRVWTYVRACLTAALADAPQDS